MLECSEEDLNLFKKASGTKEGRRKIAFFIAPHFVSDPELGVNFLRRLIQDKKAYKDLLIRILSEATMRFSSNPKYPKVAELIREEAEGWDGF